MFALPVVQDVKSHATVIMTKAGLWRTVTVNGKSEIDLKRDTQRTEVQYS